MIEDISTGLLYCQGQLITNLVKDFLRVQTRKKHKIFPSMMNKVPQMSTLKPS